MKRIPVIDKEEVFNTAREILIRDNPGVIEDAACLYWTRAAALALQDSNLRFCVQAGDLLWPIVKPEDDDGRTATHFGYEWTPHDPFSRDALNRGLLPEMHVWLGLPDTQEIIDFSTGNLREICESRHRLPWQTEAPPRYVWGQPPEGVCYRPRLEAVQFIHWPGKLHNIFFDLLLTTCYMILVT